MTARRRPAGVLEVRALNALYRSHPSTARADRYGPHARDRALDHRATLLAWAATQPDYLLLACRNLGELSLAWIRANQPPLRGLASLAQGELGSAAYDETTMRGTFRRYDYDADEGWIVENDGEGASQIVAKSVLPSFGRWVEALAATLVLA